MVLGHGKVWCYFKAGTSALMSLDDQMKMENNNSSKLQCAAVSVPKEWIIACWLTEVLSNKADRDVFAKLIPSLVDFYLKSQAPSMLKSVILKLLARLLTKLRLISYEPNPASHFKLTYISKGFVKHLI